MEENEKKTGHGDLNSAIGAAQRFAEIISSVETDLEQQVATLEGEVNLLTAKNYGLKVAVDHLEDKLKKAKKDCYEESIKNSGLGTNHSSYMPSAKSEFDTSNCRT